MLDLNVERATKTVMEPIGPSALSNVQARLQRACDREGHPTAAGLVVERTKGIETFGHGLMTGPARIETLALILDGLRRHRSFVAEAEDRELGAAGLERRRSEEHTSELQSLMRTSYAVFCLKKK